MTHKQQKMLSLRRRFISLTLALACLLAIGIAISHKHSNKISNDAFSQLSSVTKQSDLAHKIRTDLIDAFRYLNFFLLTTEQDINNTQYFHNINSALNNLKQLQQYAELNNINYDKKVIQFKDLIHELDNEVKQLFVIRINPSLQYPAMNVAYTQMQPSGKIVLGSLSIAVNELESNEQIIDATVVYQTFFQTQQIWSAMVSEFRLYMANRVGSFYEPGLQQQENNIENYYTRLIQNIALLKSLDKENKLDFEGSNAVDEILGAIQQWKTGFNLVKGIHNSKYWRTDSLIMYDKIIPLMDKLLFHIDVMERTLEVQDKNIIIHLINMTKNHNMVLAGIILFFIFYMLATLVAIEQMVFKPIAAIADVLKLKDIGVHSELQQYAKTTEIKILIDAFEEMRQQVVSRQKTLEHQTLHDELTGLPNRLMLKERINYHLSLYKRNKNKLALFILDLNHFKKVNDTLGHHIGDQLLIQVGKCFTRLLRENDTIARLGGDEFAILLPDTNAVQAINVAENINEAIESTFNINEYKLHIGVSIGIAIYPRDGEDLHTLMQHADVAMYVAKRDNRNYSHYNPEEDENSIIRLALVADLKKALKNNELELYYQPKFSFANNKISGAEALLRWHHPDFGFVKSENIIELAEQVGLINNLTRWVVDHAISYCSDCHKSGFPITISINLSAQNLKNQKICMVVKDCLKKYNVDSKYIMLEITESAMMFNPERSLEVLNVFSAMGVGLSIDDFGTGFSSLAYLRKFPVDELKIDKSFILEIDTDASNDVIVRSTIDLGHNLGLRIVAEGIENMDVYNSLQNLGCDTAQGYLMSKPLDKQIFSDWLKQNFEHNIKIIS